MSSLLSHEGVYSSTCHERTPSGPDKSVRTLQVAAHQRGGWAGGDAKYNIPCKTTYLLLSPPAVFILNTCIVIIMYAIVSKTEINAT